MLQFPLLFVLVQSLDRFILFERRVLVFLYTNNGESRVVNHINNMKKPANNFNNRIWWDVLIEGVFTVGESVKLWKSTGELYRGKALNHKFYITLKGSAMKEFLDLSMSTISVSIWMREGTSEELSIGKWSDSFVVHVSVQKIKLH